MNLPRNPALVFVGGGHAHIHSLICARDFRKAGARVFLIGPDRYHYYSGMGPGMLSRIYEPGEVRFDVLRLIESREGTFIRGKVVSVDPGNRVLYLDSGVPVPYDLVSFNVGSYIPADLIPGSRDGAYPVKPIEKLEELRKEILEKISKESPRILVIGAGPAGVEISGNICRLVQENGGRADIFLAGPGDRILPDFPEKASRLASRSLAFRGIRIVNHFRVESMENGVARAASGAKMSYDIAVLTMGIKPRPVFRESSLAQAPDGSLLVGDDLQSVSHPGVFGGGDCISIQGKTLPRVGVHAVREGPVLHDNLLAVIEHRRPGIFHPQKNYLLILNLGDGTGLFVRSPLIFRSALAFLLKDRIDRRFMKTYQVSGETGDEIH